LELLSHPPYSPDLASSDYHLFGPLKDHLRGHHDETDEAVQEAVQSWFRVSGTEFYGRGIFKILQRWQRCIDRDGDFIEK
jgi:histone-lysine N-methyltransferase SETMAR